jgi:hypothetical protein
MKKGETPFTHVISKSQRKKNKQLTRSGGQSYNTCFRVSHLTEHYEMGRGFAK